MTTDGFAWTKSDLNERVEHVEFQEGRFWTITSERIYDSVDGESWAPAGLMPEPGALGMAFQRTPFGGVCARWTFESSAGVIVVTTRLYFSADLQTWELAGELPGVNANRAFTVTYKGLVQGEGTTVLNYWVRGEGIEPTMPLRLTAWSDDGGRVWHQSTVENDSPPYGLTYGDGIFVGTWSGKMIRSTDGGRSFKMSNVVTPEILSGEILFGGGRFVTSAENPQAGRVYWSTDGLNWSSIGALGIDYLSSLRGVAFGSGRYVLAGALEESGQVPLLLVGQYVLPPVLAADPLDQEIVAGRTLRLAVEVSGGEPATYRWMKDGVTIAGATSAQLVVKPVDPSDAGAYHCEVRNAAGSIISNAAIVTVVPAVEGGRLVNLSVNTLTGTGEAALNLGFVVDGPMQKSLVVRAVGPSLAEFGVTDALADPRLQLLTDGESVGANDNWSVDDGRRLGAFALPDGSLDAVFAGDFSSKVYSVVIDGSNNASGRILAEVYDGNLDAAETLVTNLSARAFVQTGETLIVGFVVGGSRPLDLVVRAVGPSLAGFGVSNPLADPRITLFAGDVAITANDDWSGNYGESLGAFPLEAGSKDSVLAVSLNPGIYTAHVSSRGPDSSGGILLLELYDAN